MITNSITTCSGCPVTCPSKHDCYGCSHCNGYAAYYPTLNLPEPKKNNSAVKKNWKAIQKEHGRRR